MFAATLWLILLYEILSLIVYIPVLELLAILWLVIQKILFSASFH